MTRYGAGMTWPPAVPPPPVSRAVPWWLWVGLITALIASALGGGVVGSLLTSKSTDAVSPPAAAIESHPSAEAVHAATIGLCTEYAIVNSAIPVEFNSAIDLLPAVNGFRDALSSYPDADPAVRAAVAGAADAWFARISEYGHVRKRGFAEPPSYERVANQAALDRAWSACGLDQ